MPAHAADPHNPDGSRGDTVSGCYVILSLVLFVAGLVALAIKMSRDLDYCIRQTMRRRIDVLIEEERRHRELLDKISRLEREE